MAGLDLTPNEFVGYRIKPDWYSFNVVIVKRHGKESKHAGDEYDKVIAYCKSLPHAVEYILSHSLRVRGERAQDEQLAADKSVASVEALAAQYQAALNDALQAANELATRIAALGLSQKELVKALGSAEDTEPASAESAA
jgi:hypothetical protein